MTPAAFSLHIRLQGAITVPDAIDRAIEAIADGATAAEATQAIHEWVQSQGAQVQRIFAGPARRDCCTGIERQHRDFPETADISDYLRLKGEIA